MLADTPCEQQNSCTGAGICGREITRVGYVLWWPANNWLKGKFNISLTQCTLPENFSPVSRPGKQEQIEIILEIFAPETDMNQHFPKCHS